MPWTPKLVKVFYKNKEGLSAYLVAKPMAKNEPLTRDEIFATLLPKAAGTQDWDTPLEKDQSDFRTIKRVVKSLTGGGQYSAGVQIFRGGCYYALTVLGPESKKELIETAWWWGI